jgi:hypothetical protein
MFRLQFTVTYNVENGATYEEKILSRPFCVYSNRKKGTKGDYIVMKQSDLSLEKPTVTGIKPNNGSAVQETEVWIKGRGFSEKNTDCTLCNMICSYQCSGCYLW